MGAQGALTFVKRSICTLRTWRYCCRTGTPLSHFFFIDIQNTFDIVQIGYAEGQEGEQRGRTMGGSDVGAPTGLGLRRFWLLGEDERLPDARKLAKAIGGRLGRRYHP